MKYSVLKFSSVIIVLLLVLTACNNKTNDSKSETEDHVTEKPEAPAVDIHTASLLGDLKAINQHIKAGTDLNMKDQYGSSPLIITITFGKTDCGKALIEAGADIELTNNEESTPLHTAAFLCRKEIVELLLEKGADKSKKNIYGSTALESVSAPFDEVKDIYDQFSKDLGALGLKLDYDYIEETRPIIANLLK